MARRAIGSLRARRTTVALRAQCHPDRPHHVDGLCIGCYRKRRREQRHPVCHPARAYYARGVCQKCYTEIVNSGGTFSAERSQAVDLDAILPPLPPRWANLVQHACVVDLASPAPPSLPTQCAWCGSGPLACDERELRCLLCGHTTYLVSPQRVTYAGSTRYDRGRGRPNKYATAPPD